MAGSAPNVWSQMNYVPPRGPCNHKASYLSSTCACLRFMLHPLKSTSSYECDGCGHHASFHSMENKTEDEIRKRWDQEAKQRAETEQESRQPTKKRLRAIEYNDASDTTLQDNEEDCPWVPAPGMVRGVQKGTLNKKRAAPTRKATGRGHSKKASDRVTDLAEDNIVELD